MNKLIKVILFAMLLLVTAVPAAFATPYVVAGDSIYLNSWNSLDQSGIMNYTVSGGGKQFNIGTFCIQDNVDINANTWYTVGNVSDIVGWRNSTPDYNPSVAGEGPLNSRVNWLYAQYETGVFGPTGLGNQSNQSDFQNLLWYLQGEDTYNSSNGKWYSTIGTTFSTSSAWYKDYINNYASASAANPSGQWGTEVLNIVDSKGVIAQNQLVYQPVPEPSTLLMSGAGLLGLLLIRRGGAIKNLPVYRKLRARKES